MGLKAGIVGLPNVGKSTLFNAITNSHVEAANYPFATLNYNAGVVNVPDERLDYLSDLFKPERKIPAIVEFYDIAGLVNLPQPEKIVPWRPGLCGFCRLRKISASQNAQQGKHQEHLF